MFGKIHIEILRNRYIHIHITDKQTVYFHLAGFIQRRTVFFFATRKAYKRIKSLRKLDENRNHKLHTLISEKQH